MILVFVHGWSVTNTETYGQLPEAILKSAGSKLKLDVKHIFLGKYISFHDEVQMDDLTRAFEKARKDVVGNKHFSCITHSTGGPVIREWVNRFYGRGKLNSLPLKHLIMLAPANHGSALAQLGKSRIGRMKAWFEGVEPGQGILNWLELGSNESWKLNLDWLDYKAKENGFYPFVFTGEDIDKKLYDFLNSYTAEEGSDGVIRVPAANMNYRYIKLVQNKNNNRLETVDTAYKTSPPTPLYIVPNASHSGDKMGIMRSVTENNFMNKPLVTRIKDALLIDGPNNYLTFQRELENENKGYQKENRKYCLLIFKIEDDRGNPINDFDLYLLAGKNYEPDKLPKGFFVDRQRNRISPNIITYYLNAAKMNKIKDGKFGIEVVARPSEGFSYYKSAKYFSGNLKIENIFVPNQTLLIDIVLNRFVDANTFRLSSLEQGHEKFKEIEPAGKTL